MNYLAYISFIFITLQFINTLVNYIFRSKLHVSNNDNNVKMSILIPARNEEKNIAELLDNLYKIKSSILEIIVYNDNSTDNTAKIVEEFKKLDNRIILINATYLPDGWSGKNYACHQMANIAKGDYLLFIDADVRLYGNIINDAVIYAKTYNLGLLSIFPKQLLITLGEKITVPIMNYILLTLLPLELVRISPFTSQAAANGQFMLFEANLYRKYFLHKMFKNSVVEDIHIARYLKSQKVRIGCIAGENRVVCRMYNSYSEALKGFSKNILMFFGNSFSLSLFFWALVALGFIPILFVNTNYLAIYVIEFVFIQLFYSLTSNQNFVINLLLFPLQQFFLLHAIINAILIKKGKPYTWKGRYI